ncbi:MAG: hypothetical protein HS115_00520 [Spirochaetales bacterium]|nr:hypothetical protein [Spirochaetales bacterium]
MILLRNDTGRSRGKYLCYEYGQDLFGYYYLDVIRGKKHRSKTEKRELYHRPQDLICALDVHLERQEQRDYLTFVPDKQSDNRSQ